MVEDQTVDEFYLESDMYPSKEYVKLGTNLEQTK